MRPFLGIGRFFWSEMKGQIMDEHRQHSNGLAVESSVTASVCAETNTQESVGVETYYSQLDQEQLAALLQEFLPIIRRMAGAMALKNPFSLDIEDLTSVGAMGLLSALKRYDPNRDIKFRTFAKYRIRGMMLDEIRAMDWVPRSVRARREQIRQIVDEHIQKNGTSPSMEELAKALGVSQEEIEGVTACHPMLVSLDEPVGYGEDGCTLRDVLPDLEHHDPFIACANAEMKAALNAALETLSSRQQEVLQLYYHVGMTMKEIGVRLGLTESGVCRVHSGALRQLRVELDSIENGSRKKIRPKNLRKVEVVRV
jgi:RNA polymerase sigma factor for flagellar operon FliA